MTLSALPFQNIDQWTFDCFELNDVTNNQALKYVSCELLNRYGLMSKFKISQNALDKFIFEIEQGYIKYKNPYHNNMHAADVTQTVHYMLCQLGLMVKQASSSSSFVLKVLNVT